MTDSTAPTGQVTIVGLGTRGVALGLALCNSGARLRVVGHDRNPDVARRAEAEGAIHHWDGNVIGACESADLILLALPFTEVLPVLEKVAPHLKADAVVVETSPLKSPDLAWAAKSMPAERHLVGAYLVPAHPRAEAPASLYKNGLLVVVAPAGTDSGALELTTRLAPAIGAVPFFVGADEFDGLVAGAQELPVLLALACYRTIAGAPGWRDARCLAGESFARATSALEGCEAEEFAAELTANRENVQRRVDMAIATLSELSALLGEPGGRAEFARLAREAIDGREKWMSDRSNPALGRTGPAPEISSVRENFARMLGLGRLVRDGLQPKKRDKPRG